VRDAFGVCGVLYARGGIQPGLSRQTRKAEETMVKIFGAAALVAASIILPIAAQAQSKAPIYRYCLMENSHRGPWGMTLCRFDTLAQCMASRNSLIDTCYVNPQYLQRK
jgi:hypothetical protein